MNILIIEDNQLKRDKIIGFLNDSFPEFHVTYSASFNAGLSLSLENQYDLIILDMSLPTFDKTENNRGGRFRVFGGREIAQRLNKYGKLNKFLVLTGYKDFIEDTEKMTLEQVSDQMHALNNSFLGVILYESSSSKWKHELYEAIRNVTND